MTTSITKTSISSVQAVEAAMQAPKIREQGNITERLKQIYRTALITCGHKNFNPEDVKLQVSILEKSLKHSYAGVTLEELSYASEKGSIGEYGEFHGISPATFIFWLKGYLMSFERKNAMRSQKKGIQRDDTVKPVVTISEKQQFWNQCKADFQKTGRLIGETYLYKIGKELGYIDESDEIFIKEVKFKAQKYLQEQKEILKELKDIHAKDKIKSIAGILAAEEDKRSENERWVLACKRIAVEIVMK